MTLNNPETNNKSANKIQIKMWKEDNYENFMLILLHKKVKKASHMTKVLMVITIKHVLMTQKLHMTL